MKRKLPWYFITLVIIIILVLAVAIYKRQDIKQVVLGIFKVEFWPGQRPQILPPKDMPQQTKSNNTRTINQHTEGNQSPNVNVGPGATANFNYNTSKDRNPKE